jgi:hypothetical protein
VQSVETKVELEADRLEKKCHAQLNFILLGRPPPLPSATTSGEHVKTDKG